MSHMYVISTYNCWEIEIKNSSIFASEEECLYSLIKKLINEDYIKEEMVPSDFREWFYFPDETFKKYYMKYCMLSLGQREQRQDEHKKMYFEYLQRNIKNEEDLLNYCDQHGKGWENGDFKKFWMFKIICTK